MPLLRKLLAGASSPAEPPSALLELKLDYLFVLFSLLFALIGAVGFLVVARCLFLRLLNRGRRRRSRGLAAAERGSTAVEEGLEKEKAKAKAKILKSIPIVSYSGGGNVEECAICLTEFVAEGSMRVLPQCGHGFHVTCIDTWMRGSSSCPSCRRSLVEADWQKSDGAEPEEAEP